MQINIKSKNLDLTDSIYVYIDRKIGELDKFINVKTEEFKGGRNAVEAFVEVGRISYRHKKGDVFRAEVQITVPGNYTIRAESTQPDLHLAIDKVKDELQRQLKRYKEKQRTKIKKRGRRFKKLLRISELARFKNEK